MNVLYSLSVVELTNALQNASNVVHLCFVTTIVINCCNGIIWIAAADGTVAAIDACTTSVLVDAAAGSVLDSAAVINADAGTAVFVD